jgi:hypothetical protein
VTSNDARLASVASSWGLPHPLTDPGNSEILFIDWQHGVGDFEYWGNIDTQVRLQNIYVSTRSAVPDEEDPEWSGVVPVKGRYRWFMFAYTRGNEHVEEPEIELPKAYALEDDPYALVLAQDSTRLFVGLNNDYAAHHLLALEYVKGVKFLTSYGDDGTAISSIDIWGNCILTHEITNDVSDSVFCLYTRNGDNIEKVATSASHADGYRMGVWVDDDRFVTGDIYRNLYLFSTSGGAFTQLDSLDLGQYPYGVNYISVYEDYIVVAQASSWADPTSKGVGLYKVVGDELQFCDSELPGDEINQAYCAVFNYTGEYIVVTTDWKIVLLKREGNSLTVLQSLDKADVISSGAYCYGAAFSPVANYIAFADSWYPTQYIWKIENDQLVFVKTIENNVEEYCYTSTLIWSNDGQYVIAGVGGWYPQICVEKAL